MLIFHFYQIKIFYYNTDETLIRIYMEQNFQRGVSRGFKVLLTLILISYRGVKFIQIGYQRKKF